MRVQPGGEPRHLVRGQVPRRQLGAGGRGHPDPVAGVVHQEPVVLDVLERLLQRDVMVGHSEWPARAPQRPAAPATYPRRRA